MNGDAEGGADRKKLFLAIRLRNCGDSGIRNQGLLGVTISEEADLRKASALPRNVAQ
jgi:hypothetical protein